MGSELRAVALMNLGIVETWCGRLADAERHLSEGAALAQAIAVATLSHRVGLRDEVRYGGGDGAGVVTRIVSTVRVPA